MDKFKKQHSQSLLVLFILLCVIQQFNVEQLGRPEILSDMRLKSGAKPAHLQCHALVTNRKKYLQERKRDKITDRVHCAIMS